VSPLAYRLARELRSAGWTRDQVEKLLSQCKWIDTAKRDGFAFIVAHKTFDESPYAADWVMYDPEKKLRGKKKSAAGVQ